MVETIAPVVYGRKRNYYLAVALHTAAAAATGAIFGALLGAFGMLLDAPWGVTGWWILAAIAVLYAARDALDLDVPLPQLRRQVPEWWRRFYGPRVAAALYGAGLGVGVGTYLTFGTYAVVTAGVFLSGSAPVGAAACGAFGAARGLSVLVGRRARDEDASARVAERLGRPGIRLTAARVNAVVCLAAAGAAGTAL